MGKPARLTWGLNELPFHKVLKVPIHAVRNVITSEKQMAEMDPTEGRPARVSPSSAAPGEGAEWGSHSAVSVKGRGLSRGDSKPGFHSWPLFLK